MTKEEKELAEAEEANREFLRDVKTAVRVMDAYGECEFRYTEELRTHLIQVIRTISLEDDGKD